MVKVAEVFEVKSLKALQQWLKTASKRSRNWYAAPHPFHSKCLVLSPQDSFEFRWDPWTVQNRQLFRICLPTIDDARDWWFEYWEGEIVVCYFLAAKRVIVLAKTAVWNALPSLYLNLAKSDFRKMSLGWAMEYIGKPEVYAMQAEIQVSGISTRTLKIVETMRQ